MLINYANFLNVHIFSTFKTFKSKDCSFFLNITDQKYIYGL